jgi:UDP-2,3-diacylglucosamine pyrophosphatase LpxH
MHSFPLPAFDQLFVISDLHIGGGAGFQIFRRGELLSRLIDFVQRQPPEQRIGLVVNGDMVDFLAEPDAKYFDPDGAVGKLARMFADEAFEAVWEALRRLVRTPSRRLVINLGNHDLELALPWVRSYLVDRLTEGDEAAQGRIELVADGAGFGCTVGGERVLCVHGNEVDSWNFTDHEALRRQSRDGLQVATRESSWIPNAGTQLVIELMNPLKRDFAFVDLLKPEDRAVLPVLAALNEASLSRVQGFMAAFRRRKWDEIRRSYGFLLEDEGPTAEAAAMPGAAIRPGVRRAGAADTGDTAGRRRAQQATAALIAVEADHRFRSGQLGLDLVNLAEDEQLGLYEDIRAWTGKPKAHVLRAALHNFLAKDRSFSLHDPDQAFRRIDVMVTESYDFVAAGHTHMERVLRRPRGGAYFNTGSWVPRIRLRPELLASADMLSEVVRTLSEDADSVEALDRKRLPDGAPLLTYRPVVLWIQTGRRPSALLCDVLSSGDAVALEPVIGEA